MMITTTMMKSKMFVGLSVVAVLFLLVACGGNTMPKPYGYFRVDMPPHQYRTIDTLNLPYSFELPNCAKLVKSNEPGGEYWVDVNYPQLNANIYCSYKTLHGNLQELLEETRRIVYKHTVKADGIGEKVYENKEQHVYGILYDLRGNTASSVQFVLTDSTKHFFRAALYFNNIPNKDSIAPMSDYVRKDIIRMMESFKWKR